MFIGIAIEDGFALKREKIAISNEPEISRIEVSMNIKEESIGTEILNSSTFIQDQLGNRYRQKRQYFPMFKGLVFLSQ